MRGLVPGLASPHPLGPSLPALYGDDDLTQRVTRALDEVLAPALSTLDNLPSYFDPDLTPEDFLAWLAECLGMAVDPAWPADRQRALVRRAVELYRLRGTAAGLAALVETFTGAQVDVQDSGGAAWSATPGTALPGSPAAALRLRVTASRSNPVDQVRLNALVEAFKPAHVLHTIEVAGASSGRTRASAPAPPPDGGTASQEPEAETETTPPETPAE